MIDYKVQCTYKVHCTCKGTNVIEGSEEITITIFFGDFGFFDIFAF